MAYSPNNPNGQATMANSAPVVIASDQVSLSAILQNAATATGNGTTINTTGLGAMNIAVTGTFVGTVTFEAQDAAGNWNATMAQLIGTTTLTSSVTTTGVYRVHIGGFAAFRARISAYTSGAITVNAFAENTSNLPSVQNIGIYERLDSVNDSITNYKLGHSYTNITTNTTTTIKSGAGVLVGITLNNPDALTVTALTLTIYDNTAASGTKIGTWTVPFGLTGAVPFKIPYELAFTTGLTIVTAGPTVTADITVEWR